MNLTTKHRGRRNFSYSTKPFILYRTKLQVSAVATEESEKERIKREKREKKEKLKEEKRKDEENKKKIKELRAFGVSSKNILSTCVLTARDLGCVLHHRLS